MAKADIGLGSWFSRRTRQTPQRPALTFEGTTSTYAEMFGRIDRLAAALRAAGVCRGDRLAFLGVNQPAYFDLMFAAARLGAIFVPLNFRLTGSELDYIINDAGVHTLLVDAAHRPIIDGIRGRLPCRLYLSADTAADGWPPLADFTRDAAALPQGEATEEDDIALIMYTSGTTGRPKGTMLTHGNLWWANVMGQLGVDVSGDDITIVMAPLFHIGGLNVTPLSAWQKGGHVILHRAFDAGRFLADVAHYRATTVFAVPAMLLFISQHPDFEVADMSSLRVILCGGAPVPEPLLRLYNARGVPLNQGYGLTETSPSGTFLGNDFALAKLGSAGKPQFFVDLRIVGEDGRTPLGPGLRGEVIMRGPNIMRGYWNKPEATAAAIDPEGWFHSGDIGYLDDDGFLYICDRLKDMIISGGENIYPAEIEAVLYDHPAIAEVAVFGEPSERWGESVTAAAALKPGANLDLDELRDWATERLARYKLPTRLEIVDALPRNPAGKVLKFELRDRFRRQAG
jgi:fatty-acyl-CoA synthase